MKILFACFLLIAFVAVGCGQTSRIYAENVRSAERIVRGAPYSADAITESIQTLADGNKIVRRTTSRMFRDGEGRFRREDMPKQLGVPGAVIEMPESVLILDPVAGYRYTLDSKKNTARQSPFRVSFEIKRTTDFQFKLRSDTKPSEAVAKEAAKSPMPKQPGQIENSRLGEMQAKRELYQKERAAAQAEREAQMKEEAEKRRPEAPRPAIKPNPSDGNTKTESLGVQNIEGVNAEGIRTTTTIPAGTIGNEREINVVYERWYSKDLQVTVFSKHTDPRFGEQTYRLTNLNRSEPPITLFSPPPDYTIVNSEHPQAKPVPAAPKSPSSIKKVPTGPAKPPASKKAVTSG